MSTGAGPTRAALRAVLTRARDAGFLGPPPVDAHLAHAEAYLPWLEGSEVAVDLGAGGGVPGLVLAAEEPHRRWALLEASERRARFLADAVERLGLGASVVVLARRAETVGRDPAWRGGADVVVSRAFGPPAVTAECGSPLLRVGGRLVVSEPPDDRTAARWPQGPLAELGLGPPLVVTGPPRLVVLCQERPAPAPWPRPTGRPAKRPLWDPDVPRGTRGSSGRDVPRGTP